MHNIFLNVKKFISKSLKLVVVYIYNRYAYLCKISTYVLNIYSIFVLRKKKQRLYEYSYFIHTFISLIDLHFVHLKTRRRTEHFTANEVFRQYNNNYYNISILGYVSAPGRFKFTASCLVFNHVEVKVS